MQRPHVTEFGCNFGRRCRVFPRTTEALSQKEIDPHFFHLGHAMSFDPTFSIRKLNFTVQFVSAKQQ